MMPGTWLQARALASGLEPGLRPGAEMRERGKMREVDETGGWDKTCEWDEMCERDETGEGQPRRANGSRGVRKVAEMYQREPRCTN